MAHRQMRAGGRPERLLRALAGAPAGIATPEFIALLGESGPRQRLETWYGRILRDYEAKGHVRRAGRTPGGWRQGPAVIWEITDPGRYLLAAPERQRRLAELAAALDDARCFALAETARQRDDLSKSERVRDARLLTAIGCTRPQVAVALGIRDRATVTRLLRPGAVAKAAAADARRQAGEARRRSRAARGLPPGWPSAANQARTALAAPRQAAQARSILAGSPPWLGPRARRVLELRAANPGASWTQIAALDGSGATKDVMYGLFRRAVTSAQQDVQAERAVRAVREVT